MTLITIPNPMANPDPYPGALSALTLSAYLDVTLQPNHNAFVDRIAA